MFSPSASLTFDDPVSYKIARCATMRFNGVKDIMHQDEKDGEVEKSFVDSSALRDLIKRCQEGDSSAMEALYERYKRPFFNLIYRYTFNSEVAEDLLQDVFLKIFTHIREIQSEETFSGWAYRITLNTCYSYLRSQKSQIQKTISLHEVERKLQAEDHDTQAKMMKKPLDEAIQSLSKKLKSVFLLHDVQGFKHQEIAKMLGCSVGTSKSQLFKARMKIRQYLKDKQAL